VPLDDIHRFRLEIGHRHLPKLLDLMEDSVFNRRVMTALLENPEMIKQYSAVVLRSSVESWQHQAPSREFSEYVRAGSRVFDATPTPP